MPLSLQDRWIGDVAVVACAGRIVEGTEVADLERHINDLSAETRHVVLHLGDVNFIDSSGVGLLLRLLTRLRNAGGGLGLLAVQPRIREVLVVTRLSRILEAHDSEADAIAAAFRAPANRRDAAEGRCILCVEQSADVLAYVRELLRSAGFLVVCAGNLPDALTLLTATRPKAVVIGHALRSSRDTRAAASFNERANALRVIELPGDFSTDDAGHAGSQLLDQVRTLMELADAAPN